MSNRKRSQAHIQAVAVQPPIATPRVDAKVLIGVIACFTFSGFAALLYQTAWMRQFSVVFGTSELAVATVLAAYMAGLGLGSAIAARFVDCITRPVLVYGFLEAGVAVSALAVPLLLALADALYVGLLGAQAQPPDASGLGQSLFYLVVAFVVLAIPTGCMGATLPMLTKYVVRSEQEIGPRVGLLYAMNTVGAVGGTVTAGFLLLPALGLSATVWVGVAINALVFVLAAVIARSVAATPRSGTNAEPSVAARAAAASQAPAVRLALIGSFWILPLMLLSGANSFMYEVLWTRLLGHILGGSIVAFSTMLASFLGGIAIGSAIAAKFAKDRSTAVTGFIIAQFGVALTSISIYGTLHWLIPETVGLQGNVLLAIATLLPATLFIGATFPFAVRILARDETTAAPASARVYAWNTFGAIVGAAIAGFVLIPLLRYEGAIELAVTVNVALAFAASLLLTARRYRTALGSGLAFALVLLLYRPDIPEEILRTSPIGNSTRGDIRYYEVGRSATVLVLEEDGYFNLRTNGLPEASTNLKGAPPYLSSQRLLSTLPVLARPDIRGMLIVGFGGGIAVEGVPPSVTSVDVIELEPKVIEANRLIGPERQIDPLQDERVHVYINDARSALALTSKRYDAIVSQPSHPWTAGASHLYTREFMALAKNHLNPGGVFLQWMNIQFLTESLFRSLCATVLEVYPYVRVYQMDAGDLFFIGSDRPLDIERQLSLTGQPLVNDPVRYREKGIGAVEDLLAALTMDERNFEMFAQGASSLLTDNFNRMATESAVAMENNQTLTLGRLTELMLPYTPLLQSDSWVHQNYPNDLNFAYIADRLEAKGFKKNAMGLANTLEQRGNGEFLLLVGIGLERQKEREKSQQVLLQAIQADPTSNQAKFALLRPWLSRLLRSDTPEYVTQVATRLTDSAAAVLMAWQAAAQQNWQELVRLDAQLSRARSTDQWYSEAIKLRADWRLKVTTPEYQPRLAQEAQRLLDGAIAIYQDPDLYSMRVAAAFVANDAAAALETVRRLIYIFNDQVDRAVEGTLDVDPASIDFKLKQIEGVRQVVEQVRSENNIPSYKTEQLDRSLLRLVERLQELRAQKIASGSG